MSGGGFDAARLGRVRAVLDGYVERGAVPGVATAVARRGEVHVEVAGRQAVEGAELRRDAIFRLQSLSKPIAAVGALTLVEECRLRLDDPVDPWLPELADRRVLARVDGPLEETVPAERAITVRDVLTSRLGYGQFIGDPETHPILRAMQEQGIDVFPPNTGDRLDMDEWMRRLGALPLLFQPGERWIYNTPSDVLGVLIARVTGQSLKDALRERVLAPLGMDDTGFTVPAEKLDRFVTAYEPDEETGALRVLDDPANSAWAVPPAFASAAGNMVSTIDDYLAFARMLLDNGVFEGRRVLSRAAVELMTSDHLTAEQRAGAWPILDEGSGWGFGVSVVGKRDAIWATPGRYGWFGGLESTWFNDPAEDLVTILLANTPTDASNGWPPLLTDFWTTVYGALG